MAHVPLQEIGSERDKALDKRAFAANEQTLKGREDDLAGLRAKVAEGWGSKYRERVHAKGKLTARERIDLLRDPDSRLFEVGTFVNHERAFGKLHAPGAGVITAFCEVHGRWTMVIANDNTVASGSWWPLTPEKIQRAQEMARRLSLPAV